MSSGSSSSAAGSAISCRRNMPELVNENIRRRFAGEPAAERYEIDMVGLQGQLSRLEITSALVDYEGAPALLITGVEIIPTQTVQHCSCAGSACRDGSRPCTCSRSTRSPRRSSRPMRRVTSPT